ncbi:hypothetical protein DFH07DRAFT_776446 [Mycena maculata]|uniref:Uncharacterized protein n=1 Tax=Mycena maculata TaxID=230809 RepID=A0AAD7N5B7_9AGAR|nr:hypothetical protein DFH07DRAFT_776446 [Mycena maculata]
MPPNKNTLIARTRTLIACPLASQWISEIVQFWVRRVDNAFIHNPGSSSHQNWIDPAVCSAWASFRSQIGLGAPGNYRRKVDMNVAQEIQMSLQTGILSNSKNEFSYRMARNSQRQAATARRACEKASTVLDMHVRPAQLESDNSLTPNASVQPESESSNPLITTQSEELPIPFNCGATSS